MARAIIGAGAVVWSLLCIAAAIVAIVGVERLVELLPPLQVDAEAVRGAVIAGAVGFAVASGAHVAVLVGLRAHRRRAWSAGILLAAVLSLLWFARLP